MIIKSQVLDWLLQRTREAKSREERDPFLTKHVSKEWSS